MMYRSPAEIKDSKPEALYEPEVLYKEVLVSLSTATK